MKVNKKEFIVNINGEDVVLYIVKPSFEVQQKANLVRVKAFSEAVKNGAMLRFELDDCMKKRGIWSDEKQKELDDLDNKISELIVKIKKGGIKLSEAKNIAFETKKLRDQRKVMLMERTSFDRETAEGQSEQEALSYVVSRCILNKEGNPYFKSYEDFLQEQNTEISRKGFITYFELMSDLNISIDDLPEDQFLRKYKFADDKGRLINKDGKLVDEDGRLIDEKGRFINENGELIDKNGLRVDESGNYVVDFSPFLDENNNPID